MPKEEAGKLGVVATEERLVTKTSSSIELVGKETTSTISIEGHDITAYLDTGSQISTLNENFVQQLGLEIVPVEECLTIRSAGGHQLPYSGMVVAELASTDWQKSITVPLLVVKEDTVNRRIPLLLGTNVLSNIDLNNGKTIWHAVKTLLRQSVGTAETEHPESFKPRESRMLKVRCLNDFNSESAVLAEQTVNCNLPAGLLMVPSISSVQSNRLHVKVQNLTDHEVHLPGGHSLCELFLTASIRSVDSADTSTATCQLSSVGQESTDRQLFLDLFKFESMAPDLERHEADELKDLLWRNQDVFSRDDFDIGRTDIVRHSINLEDNKPFKERFRRIPPAMFAEVKEHLEHMLETGVIRKSHSPYASPVVIARKKDNSMRFCIDLRKLNAKTTKDAYNLPRIEESLEMLAGSSWFSCLDLRAGYWQVELEESDKPKTAFTVGPLGFYECNRMPFGLTNAPATFQRLMETALGDAYLSFCLVYLDDVVVFSGSIQEHLTRLQRVFDKFRVANLKLKPSKCVFLQQKIKYLGHVVSAQGIAPDESKVEAVRNWPVPTTVTELKSFLGFIGYYRRFIPNFALTARCLHDLLGGGTTKKSKKKVPVKSFVWTSKEQNAFDALKKSCTEAPVLTYADFSKPFIVHTDASLEGLGAVLYQKVDGRELPIAFASRSLSKGERNYPAFRLEFLALKWAITDKFADYLYNATFEVWTDNNPLTYVLTSAKLDSTTQRWVAALSSYKFSIHYRPGRTNQDADGLSRIHWPAMQEDVVAAALRVDHLPVALLLNTDVPEPDAAENMSLSQERDWKQLQSEDTGIVKAIAMCTGKDVNVTQLSPEERTYFYQRKRLRVIAGILYRVRKDEEEETKCLVLPESCRQEAIVKCHDELGHLGREKTLKFLAHRFYWPKMTRDSAKYVAECVTCLKAKAKPHRAPLINVTTSYPLQLVCMDFVCIEPSGKHPVLVITDHFTRYAVAVSTRNQKASTTARALLNHFVLPFGMPQTLHSDQGRNFESSTIKSLCRLMGVKRSRTTPYHPMGNGSAERYNQTLISMLRSLPAERKPRWKDYLGTLTHAYNSAWNEATGFSPHYLMFGRHPKLPVDLAFGLPTDKPQVPKAYPAFVEDFKQKLESAYAKARARVSTQHQGRKQQYDKRVRGACLMPGDIVLVKKNVRGTKIDHLWEDDLFEVIHQPDPDTPVFKVKQLEGDAEKVLHRNSLLPVGSIPMQSELADTDAEPPDGISNATIESSDYETDSEDDSYQRPRRDRQRPDRYDPSRYL